MFGGIFIFVVGCNSNDSEEPQLYYGQTTEPPPYYGNKVDEKDAKLTDDEFFEKYQYQYQSK